MRHNLHRDIIAIDPTAICILMPEDGDRIQW